MDKKSKRDNLDEDQPGVDLELPTWVGSNVGERSEINSSNVKEWIREHWADDIERRKARREDTNFWNVLGFEEVEVEGLANSRFHLWRKPDEPKE